MIFVINDNHRTQGSLSIAGQKSLDPCVTDAPCDHMETRLYSSSQKEFSAFSDARLRN